MTANLELQFNAVRDRLEIMRLHWLRVCQFRCQPTIEEDLEIMERELKELRELVNAACNPTVRPPA